MAHDPAFWALAVLAAVLTGMGKGGMPIVGMLGVPVLALSIPAVTAAGLLLPVFILSDMFGLYAYRHDFDRRNLVILVPAAVLGIAVGWATASLVEGRVVNGLVGAIGLAFALTLLLRRGPQGPARPARIGPGLFWGAITGFTSFVSHAGAPPYQVYVLPQRLEKMVYAGTTTILFAIVNVVKLVPYYALGQLSPANLKVAAVLCIPAALAVFAGLRLVRVIPEKLFFRLVTWALLLVSLKLLWDAFG
ncbi:MAG: sulfite exporter TauE/SafE family protein [Rhodobacteraceae bacterium]|nr:sulfite exporter TauE/SafE family protein [Paracoccaceae bacterium]